MAEAVVAARLVKDRYIVLFPYHVNSKQKPKHKPAAKTTQQKKHKHNKNNPHKTKNRKPHSPKAVTWWVPVRWKRSVETRGDSLVSTRRMQMTTYVSCWAGPLTKTTAKTTNHHGPSKGCRSNTAQCGNQGSPCQDPRDHREQPSWHNSHPDTLKQTPTTPGRNKVVSKLPQWNRRVKHGLRWKRRRGNSTQGTLRVRSVLLFQSSYCSNICE